MATNFGFKARSIPNEHNFVSYNRFDSEIIAPVVKLIDEQRPIWYDEGLIPGAEWESYIVDQVAVCKVAVIFVGNALFQRDISYVCDEFRFIQDFKKTCVCVWLDDINTIDLNNTSRDLHTLYEEIYALPAVRLYEFDTIEEKAQAVIVAMDEAYRNSQKKEIQVDQDERTTNSNEGNNSELNPNLKDETNSNMTTGADSAFLAANGENADSSVNNAHQPVIEPITPVMESEEEKETLQEESEIRNTSDNDLVNRENDNIEKHKDDRTLEHDRKYPRKIIKYIIPFTVIFLVIIIILVIIIDKSDNIYDINRMKSVKNVEVGDYLTFGTYEQDGDTSNGQEPIEWCVLEKQDNKILLISKDVLDYKKFSEDNNVWRWNEGFEYHISTWEKSTLRNWLNDVFLNTAFTSEEQEKIQYCIVQTPDSPEYGYSGGDDTEDKVYILSKDEYDKYRFLIYNKENAKEELVTTYADSIYTDHFEFDRGTAPDYFWLRSPFDNEFIHTYDRTNLSGGVTVIDESPQIAKSVNGALSFYIGYKYPLGSINHDTNEWVTRESERVDSICGIRPVIWVQIGR